jgi:hypothetical protein
VSLGALAATIEAQKASAADIKLYGAHGIAPDELYYPLDG